MVIFTLIYLYACNLFEVVQGHPAMLIHLLLAANYFVGATIAYQSGHRPFVVVYLTCSALYIAQCSI